ncbi:MULTISPECIES: hypothetical protein [Flavobacteriaceae]|nr:hypothetical protein [Muricauda sp. SP22]MDC6361777.1 hypothetical protein [Muricauda sp. SP22]
MIIRCIHKYTVVKRFSLGKRLYDKMETIYIQEHDHQNGESQKVFNSDKEYVIDISADIYVALNKDFIVRNRDNE